MTPAGPIWVERFPGSRDVADLAEPFRGCVVRFLAALAEKGCRVNVTATYRPPERAGLMQDAWDVSRGTPPGNIPARPGVDILWTLDGARAMVEGYGLVVRPAGTASRHCQRRAIDMDISGWSGTTAELHALGASFGVHPLASDRVHWSDDGH